MVYDIPAGAAVMVNAWAIARDPLLGFSLQNFSQRGFNSELIPFGAGSRGCPGTTFVVAVNELALAKLVYKFDFAWTDGAKPHDLYMSEATGLTNHRKNPVFAVAIPHSS